jgi:DNA-binding transcriptional MerR regulator
VADEERKKTAVADLVEFQRGRAEAQRRYVEEQERQWRDLLDLVLRARDAGLRNKEIADALNYGDDTASAQEYGEGRLWAPAFTTQRITSLIAEAEAEARHAVERLTREAGRETSDDDES